MVSQGVRWMCEGIRYPVSISFTAIVMLLAASHVVAAPPVGAIVSPLCGPLVPPSPLDPSAWRPWSSPSTWPNNQVPARGSNVLIACGQNVVLDIPALANNAPSVVLNKLNISGSLLLRDNPTTGSLSLSASYIFVHGSFLAGDPTQHYRQRATITLTTGAVTPDPLYPEVGFKVFAVYGGQVLFYGMPGGGATPAWGRITRTAPIGSNSLLMDRNPGAWPIGGRVVVATSDFVGFQSEDRIIVANSNFTLTLDRPLNFNHWGKPVYTGVPGRFMIQSAEVILLTRNIVIQGANESATPLIGGHFIVFQTSTPQNLFGVEFVNMGQQGNLGRYPVHFHLCLDQPFSFVSKCSVHESQQRGYVTHGTNYLTWQENVAYNTQGHVYFIEDGFEIGNKFINNVGILSFSPQVRLTRIINGRPELESDNQPAIFWISNPNNTWTGNVAVGGETSGSGYWFELRRFIVGPSVQLPGAATYNPQATSLGLFDSNIAHGQKNSGLLFYPPGYFPQALATVSRFTSYKTEYGGAFLHGAANIVVTNSLIADSAVLIDFWNYAGLLVKDSILMGYTDNFGSPVDCSNGYYYACIPIGQVGCPAGFNFNSVPQKPGPGWRTVSASLRGNFHLGVALAANMVSNVTFVNMDNRNCYQGGSLGWDNRQGEVIPVSSRVNRTTFVNTTSNQFGWIQYAKPFTYIIFDQDGTVSGTRVPTFIIANYNPAVLPAPASLAANCAYNPSWNAFACANVCYRSVLLEYDEPGTFVANQPVPARLSFVIVTRRGDGATQSVTQGNVGLNSRGDGTATIPRRFSWSLDVSGTYDVTFGNVTVNPSRIWLSYRDIFYYYNGSSYNLMQPGPPCSADAVLFFPNGVVFGAPVRPLASGSFPPSADPALTDPTAGRRTADTRGLARAPVTRGPTAMWGPDGSVGEPHGTGAMPAAYSNPVPPLQRPGSVLSRDTPAQVAQDTSTRVSTPGDQWFDYQSGVRDMPNDAHVSALSLQAFDVQQGVSGSVMGTRLGRFGLDRAQAEAEASIGDPRETYTVDTPPLSPVPIPPAPPLGPPPPPVLPIVGRRKV